MNTTWQWIRSHRTPYYVYGWRSGADTFYGYAVVDDFGNLILLS